MKFDEHDFKWEKHDTINGKIGTLYDVFARKTSFSMISQSIYKRLNMGNEKYYNDFDAIFRYYFVNWKIYSQIKNEQGRYPLVIASEQSITWSDGLCQILKGYGGAIEEVDVLTGLEAFMLAAIGTNSDMETVYNLLLDHPAAINPYV